MWQQHIIYADIRTGNVCAHSHFDGGLVEFARQALTLINLEAADLLGSFLI